MLDGIARWVEIDSPTHDRDGVNRMMDAAAAAMYGLGATITRHPGRDGLGDAVVARVGPDEPGILVLAHLDTVHPVGVGRRAHPPRGRPVLRPRAPMT